MNEQTTMTEQHKAGSRKSQVHSAFEREGPEAALALGRELQLKPRTVAGWIADWRRATRYRQSDDKPLRDGPQSRRESAAEEADQG